MVSQVTLSTSKEDYIMATLERARPMITRLAQLARLEKEDCEQEAVVAMLNAFSRMSGYSYVPTNIVAYLHRAIHNHLVKIMLAHEYTTSLDEPLSSESTLTLGDTLMAIEPEPEPANRSEKEAILYAALHQLPLEQQIYARNRYQLNAFDPVPPAWQKPEQVKYNQEIGSTRRGMMRRLRRDPELLALFSGGREGVCQ